MTAWQGGRLLLLVAGLGSGLPALGMDLHVGVDDPRLIWPGAWLRREGAMTTPYPGSALEFELRGSAVLEVTSGNPDAIRLRLSLNDTIRFDGVWNGRELTVDTGTNRMTCRLVFVASQTHGFNADGLGKRADLTCTGIRLGASTELYPVSREPPAGRVLFFGDSITAGEAIRGRRPEWQEASDVTLTFGFRAARSAGLNYEIRAFPGAGASLLTERLARFRDDLPAPTSPAPDWMVINAGANDRHLSARAYRRVIGDLLRQALSLYPETHILLLNFFRMTPNRLPDLQYAATRYGDGRTMILDTRACLVDYSDGNVHPGTQSHQKLADVLTEWLAARMATRYSDDEAAAGIEIPDEP